MYDPSCTSALTPSGVTLISNGGQEVYSSIDGGATWSRQCAPWPSTASTTLTTSNGSNAFTFQASDPSIAWDTFGNAYLFDLVWWQDASGTYSGKALCIDKWTSTTNTWSGMSTVGTNYLGCASTTCTGYDKTWIGADTTSGGAYSHTNRLYAMFEVISYSGGWVYTGWKGYSDPPYTTWTTGTFQPGGTTESSTVAPRLSQSVVVGADGTVYYAWDRCAATGSSMMISKSIDGGVTWSAAVAMASTAVLTDFAASTKIAPQDTRGIALLPTLAVDASGGTYNGRLYMAYTDYHTGVTSGADVDVYVRRSTDGGATWSTVATLAGTAGSTAQFEPTLTVDKSSGTITIAWYDTSIDATNNRHTQVFYSQSTDGGTTWSAQALVTDTGANFSNHVSYADENSTDVRSVTALHHYQYGEYLGISASGGNIWVAWTDSRNFYPTDSGNLEYEDITVAPITAACTSPSAPAITAVVDADPCIYSGIKVTYTPGAGATTHNLVIDGQMTVANYASGAIYLPGDALSHTYVVQAANACGTADSTGVAGTDAATGAPPAPTISSVTDASPCASSGVIVNFTNGGTGTNCVAQTAEYNSTYQSPACTIGGKSCDTGTEMIACAYTWESKYPNTINSACADGTAETSCHYTGGSFESVEQLSIATNDGTCLAVGKAVTVTAKFWCTSSSTDRVAVYYTTTVPGSGDATWTSLGTSTCGATGAVTKTYTTTLGGSTGVQAVRAQVVGAAITSACQSGTARSDRDDLIFTVISPTSTSSDNLLEDGTPVVTGYTSGATYNPGDSSSHTYMVQAVNGSCATNSAGVAGTDANNAPGAPTITSITDVSACAQSGIQVNYTAGSPAGSSYNLQKDSVTVVSGYTSGATYNPGDTSTHTYIIQAVLGACTTLSAGSAFADANTAPGAPTITSITDVSACAQSGIQVNFTAGSPAGSSYNLKKDNVTVVTGYTSGASYNPGDTSTHTYIIQAVIGTCTTLSTGSAFADTNSAPGSPTITSITDVDACAQSGIKVYFTAGSPAGSSYNLQKDGVNVVSGYTSGATYNPGDTGSHTYNVQAVSGSCTTLSADSVFADASGAPGAPSITSITDISTCLQNGIQVNFTAGSPAGSSYNLYDNGSPAVVGYTSGATYNPGDTASHTYVIRAISGSCNTDSSPMAGTDVSGIGCGGGVPPEVDPGTSGPSSALRWSGTNTIVWDAVTGATFYTVYRGILGDLPNLLNAGTDSCTLYTGSGTSATDNNDPSLVVGSMYWYLVTASNGNGEGSAGNATAGARTVNSTGTCPP